MSEYTGHDRRKNDNHSDLYTLLYEIKVEQATIKADIKSVDIKVTGVATEIEKLRPVTHKCANDITRHDGEIEILKITQKEHSNKIDFWSQKGWIAIGVISFIAFMLEFMPRLVEVKRTINP